MAIYEVLPIDHELAECIKTNNAQVGAMLKERGISTLAENAFDLFEKGETTIEEVYSILFNSYA